MGTADQLGAAAGGGVRGGDCGNVRLREASDVLEVVSVLKELKDGTEGDRVLWLKPSVEETEMEAARRECRGGEDGGKRCFKSTEPPRRFKGELFVTRLFGGIGEEGEFASSGGRLIVRKVCTSRLHITSSSCF